MVQVPKSIEDQLQDIQIAEQTQGKLKYTDGSEYIGGLKEVDGERVRQGLGTLNLEKGLDRILYKYEGPWTEDQMGEGPGELLIYIVTEQKTATCDGEENGKE